MIKIKYIPKKCSDCDKPHLVFGTESIAEYKKWNPEICGICCLKMIGDIFGETMGVSLYQLTMECLQKGGFKELPNGKIEGVFHKPLLELAKDYGLEGSIEKHLTPDRIISLIQDEKFIILSINKSRVDPESQGGHLILIYSYDPDSKMFILHDPEPILSENGASVEITRSRLEEISNKKGLIIYS